jgi:hypothetical protein
MASDVNFRFLVSVVVFSAILIVLQGGENGVLTRHLNLWGG